MVVTLRCAAVLPYIMAALGAEVTLLNYDTFCSVTLRKEHNGKNRTNYAYRYLPIRGGSRIVFCLHKTNTAAITLLSFVKNPIFAGKYASFNFVQCYRDHPLRYGKYVLRTYSFISRAMNYNKAYRSVTQSINAELVFTGEALRHSRLLACSVAWQGDI